MLSVTLYFSVSNYFYLFVFTCKSLFFQHQCLPWATIFWALLKDSFSDLILRLGVSCEASTAGSLLKSLTYICIYAHADLIPPPTTSSFCLSVPDHVQRRGSRPRPLCQPGFKLHHQQYLWRERGECLPQLTFRPITRVGAFMTPEVATMLLVSRVFSEGARRCAVCVYVLLVKMMKCPNKDIPSVPFLLKSKHCWAFYFLSLARSNPVTPRWLVVLEKPGPRKVRWRSSWYYCLTPRTDSLLCKGRQIYLYFFSPLHFQNAKKTQKTPNFLGPSVLLIFSQLSKSLSQGTTSQQGSPDHPHHSNFLKKPLHLGNANPGSIQMFKPSELLPVSVEEQ